MKYRAVICDLDGSLMNPSSGLYVKETIADLLCKLQQKGVLVILNSARTFQGVYPLSKQIHMESFGGYCISCNGANVFDAMHQETVFEYPIDVDVAKGLWDITLRYHLEPGFTQHTHALAHQMTDGYLADAYNCNLEYRISEQFVAQDSIWKFCISGDKRVIDGCYEQMKQEMEQTYPVLVVRSTPDMIDVVIRGVDKYQTCDRLLAQLSISWEEVSTIGDGTSDLECVQASGLGVTLENGKDALKEIADLVLPSCYEDGCVEWLNMLLAEL